MKTKSIKAGLLAGLFVYLLLAWGTYRFLTDFPMPVDELVFKPLIWLIPVLILVWQVEGRGAASLGLFFDQPFKRIVLGLLLSLFILSEYLIALVLKGKPIGFNPQQLSVLPGFLYSLSCLATGVVEELTFRGFFMTRINQLINSKLSANIFAGLLFFLIHLPILIFDQGLAARGLVEYFVLFGSLSLLDGYVFWWTKGIVAPISAHFFLNFFSLLVG